ncbi:MAG: nucleotide exchange factor GrpE [Kiritimatiellaeota bacterium]|nr:nucleotide exchange factor GrpE [Kiritimatiellota bacterium]
MKDKKNHKSAMPEAAPAAEPAATPQPAPAPDALAQLKDQLLRLQADFDNYRKRTLRDRAESEQQAAARLIGALLPALDHFQLGLKNAQAHAKDANIVTGFQMIYTQLMEAFTQAGLAPLPVEGQPFDPNQHEAVTSIASEEHPEGTVITEVRRGYTLGGKLLRPAQVIVSRGPAEPLTPAPVAEPVAEPEIKALPEEGAV